MRDSQGDLDKALADIVAIRMQIARDTAFRGLGAATLAGEIAGKIDRFELGALAAQERPLGLAIEVDPPLGAGEDDDEHCGGHDTQTCTCAAALPYAHNAGRATAISPSCLKIAND